MNALLIGGGVLFLLLLVFGLIMPMMGIYGEILPWHGVISGGGDEEEQATDDKGNDEDNGVNGNVLKTHGFEPASTADFVDKAKNRCGGDDPTRNLGTCPDNVDDANYAYFFDKSKKELATAVVPDECDGSCYYVEKVDGVTGRITEIVNSDGEHFDNAIYDHIYNFTDEEFDLIKHELGIDRDVEGYSWTLDENIMELQMHGGKKLRPCPLNTDVPMLVTISAIRDRHLGRPKPCANLDCSRRILFDYDKIDMENSKRYCASWEGKTVAEMRQAVETDGYEFMVLDDSVPLSERNDIRDLSIDEMTPDVIVAHGYTDDSETLNGPLRMMRKVNIGISSSS